MMGANMDFSDVFVDLYQAVLEREKNMYQVSDQQIREAIQTMKDVYMPNRFWQHNHVQVASTASFKKPSYRCAYLHKYAMCYTGMVSHILQLAIRKSNEIFEYINSKKRLTLCSLGGGPGTDVIGTLAAVYACCQYMPCSVTVVDYYEEWIKTFNLIVVELLSGNSKCLKSMVTAPQFQYGYVGANLLEDVAGNSKVREIVKAADFLTMVKFVSAAACQTTSKMIKDIFSCMKPGAMLLFIDNAAGGFQEMMHEAANVCGMVTVFGPLQHYDYENIKYSHYKFGYKSQSKTKVAVQVWRKPQSSPFNTTQDLRNDYFAYRNDSGHIAVDVHQNEELIIQEERSGCCRGRCCSII